MVLEPPLAAADEIVQRRETYSKTGQQLQHFDLLLGLAVLGRQAVVVAFPIDWPCQDSILVLAGEHYHQRTGG